MRLVEMVQRPSAEQVRNLSAFVDDVAAELGERPLSDHLWLDLRSGGSPGFHVITASDESGIISMAQISATNESSTLEVVVRPDVADAPAVRADVVDTAVDTFRRSGGGRLSWWLDDPSETDRAFAEDLGFVPVRGLHEMRRSLPLDDHATIDTRAFVPGVDDDAWLAVNNRAFAEHGEQGGWTREVLALRLAEPWFDPTGFLVHEIEGRLAAFCWTKIHDEHDPAIGEIYVIAVDPDFHGRGLGKQLTLAGLDSIAARGIRHANLYVDADNHTAVGLYERLGFTIHRSRLAVAGDF